MEYFHLIFIFLIAYLIGSIPTAYLVVKLFEHKDIRQEETGNIGAMNTMRTTGKVHLFLLVFILDALKGLIGVRLPIYLGLPAETRMWAVTAGGFGIVLGHCYSIYFKVFTGRFAGGKAIASLFGILMGVSFWSLFAPWGIIMLLTVLITGNLFAGQFFGALALPFIGFFLLPTYFPLTLLTAVVVLIRQAPRVPGLLRGEEPNWYFKKVASRKQ